MATYPVTKERMNYSRLCRAIVDLCTDEYRDILHRRINPINLMTTVSKCADSSRFKPQDWTRIRNATGAGSYKDFDITLLYQILRAIFIQDLRDTLKTKVNPSQIYVEVQKCSALSLHPTTQLTSAEINNIKTSVTKNSYDNLKDELLWKLYVHLCPVHSGTSLIHPTKLWGQDPDPGAITLGDDIEWIRILRNKVYGHITTTEISDAKLAEHWKLLEDITIRIDYYLKTRYKDSLDDIKTSSLDAETANKYFDQIRKLAEELEQNKSDIADLKAEITAVTEKQGEMDCNLNTVSEHQGEMAGDLTGLKTKLNTEVNPKVYQLETEIETLKEGQETMATNMNTVEGKVEQTKTQHEQTKRITTRLERDVGHLKSISKDPVPEHLRDRYNIKLEEWNSEDAVFIETRACVSVRNAIEENTFVTVSGNAGSGKSAIIHHLALEFKSNGFDVIPANDPDDIDKYLRVDQKQLFVYDDPVGVHCLNREKYIKWFNFKIGSSDMTKNMKVLCSVRRQIVNESDYKSSFNVLNKTVVDIQDDKNKLTLTEKIEMIEKHIKEGQLELIVSENARKIIDKQDELFPLACQFYVSSKEMHITNDWTFFQNPFKLILDDLEKMEIQDKVKYCILILCLVSENSLNPELYTPDSTVEFTKEGPFIIACKLTRESMLAGFENGTGTLLNVYLKRQNGLLSFCHDFIYEVISYHFSQKHLKLVLKYFPSKFISSRVIVGNSESDDPNLIRVDTTDIKFLIDRMLMDLEKKDFKNVFMNKCWRNDTFLDIFQKTFDSKIEENPGHAVLNIFTEIQQRRGEMASDLKQISGKTIGVSKMFNAIALCSAVDGVTALHWIASLGYSKLFNYIWRKLSSAQKATVVDKLTILHFASMGGEMQIINTVLKTMR